MRSDIEGNRLLANYKDFKEYIENKFYNERIVREVTVIKRSGDFYTVQFGTNGVIQVSGNRLFASQEDAEASLAKNRRDKRRYSSPLMIIFIGGRG